MLALMRPPFLFLSMEVHDALAAQYVDERVLVEILCTKTSAEIKQINEAYKRGELKLSYPNVQLKCDFIPLESSALD